MRLPPPADPLKSRCTRSSVSSAMASSAGSLTAQSFCGDSRRRAPLAPPRLSVPRWLEPAAHAVLTSWDTESPEPRRVRLSAGDVGVIHQRVVDLRDGVLPQLRLRHPGAEEARHRAHVAVQQLVPGAREGVGELLGVLVEPTRDGLVHRVEAKRQVGRQHGRRVPLGGVVRVHHGGRRGVVLGLPLLGAGGAGGELPLEPKRLSKNPLSHLVGCGGPDALQPAGDGVGADAACRRRCASRGPGLRWGRPRARARCAPGSPRRASCRRCGRRRSTRRSPRRSWPCGRNVSRMSRAALTGSGSPFGPSGLT